MCFRFSLVCIQYNKGQSIELFNMKKMYTKYEQSTYIYLNDIESDFHQNNSS